MLFNSYIFIFLFLPIALLGFHLIGSVGRHRVAISWLVLSSLLFYSWWNPAYLILIISSMLFNYSVGLALTSNKENICHPKRKKSILVFGVLANLLVLGYYKYANFFVDNINLAFGYSYTLETILLPLAISFFTFQQIAYLVDAYRGETRELSFLHYSLFVTFFPQLIAGPIVHHKEMLPQFLNDSLYQIKRSHLVVGLTIFIIGLFKKVVLADSVAVYSTPIFNAADSGITLTFFEAWLGALSYSMQLYFDFSGYSDMAVGLARMFGVRLPLNFNSPYKSTSIIDFWRRWHITLSRFLRDYLYIPLGGSKKGELRRLSNLMITMLLGGLWHGAGWTFVLWGGLHGVYLVINHLWRNVSKSISARKNKTNLYIVFSWSITFIAVTVAWVPFRSETIGGAFNMLSSMLFLNGVSLPDEMSGRLGYLNDILISSGFVFEGMFKNGVVNSAHTGILIVTILLFISVFAPNTQQLMRRYKPAFETYRGEIKRMKLKYLEWRPLPIWAVYTALLFMVAILGLSEASEFLYFQF